MSKFTRSVVAPGLLLALAACAATGGPTSDTTLTVNETAVNDPGGPYALVVGIQNGMAVTIKAPLCGTAPDFTASAYRETLVDGAWVVSGGMGTCGLADASEVADVPALTSKDLLRMVVPNQAGSYRFHWSVPTSGGEAVDLVSPTIVVTITP